MEETKQGSFVERSDEQLYHIQNSEPIPLVSVYTCLECGELNHKRFEVKETKFCCYCGSNKIKREEYNYFQYVRELIRNETHNNINNINLQEVIK